MVMRQFHYAPGAGAPWKLGQVFQGPDGGGQRRQQAGPAAVVGEVVTERDSDDRGPKRRQVNGAVKPAVSIYDTPPEDALQRVHGRSQSMPSTGEYDDDLLVGSTKRSNSSSTTLLGAEMFRDLCYLHTVKPGDTIPIMALKYNTTAGLILDVNQMKADDLDILPAATLLVVPASNQPGIVAECCALNTDPDFLEKYGSRLPQSFRRTRVRRAPAAAAPEPDGLDAHNEAFDPAEFERGRPRPPPRSGMPSSSVAYVARTFRSWMTPSAGVSKAAKKQ
ncbi:hypothetical protein DIPPA_30361 [Diplonema papillatum]|nr:hypothetical protein DIPPA_30361 [Diplonema papillatum]